MVQLLYHSSLYSFDSSDINNKFSYFLRTRTYRNTFAVSVQCHIIQAPSQDTVPPIAMIDGINEEVSSTSYIQKLSPSFEALKNL
jgi:hypothetical protein